MSRVPGLPLSTCCLILSDDLTGLRGPVCWWIPNLCLSPATPVPSSAPHSSLLRRSLLTVGTSASRGDVWQCLEMLVVVTTGVGGAPGHAEHPAVHRTAPQRTVIQPQKPAVQRLKSPGRLLAGSVPVSSASQARPAHVVPLTLGHLNRRLGLRTRCCPQPAHGLGSWNDEPLVTPWTGQVVCDSVPLRTPSPGPGALLCPPLTRQGPTNLEGPVKSPLPQWSLPHLTRTGILSVFLTATAPPLLILFDSCIIFHYMNHDRFRQEPPNETTLC
nr:uncharacterized protein LOC105880305 [Microcebus murinus]